MARTLSISAIQPVMQRSSRVRGFAVDGRTQYPQVTAGNLQMDSAKGGSEAGCNIRGGTERSRLRISQSSRWLVSTDNYWRESSLA